MPLLAQTNDYKVAEPQALVAQMEMGKNCLKNGTEVAKIMRFKMTERRKVMQINNKFIVWAVVSLGLYGVEAQAACDPKVRPASFAEFKKCTYQEIGTGIWIVDGDVPITSEKALKAFYESAVRLPDPSTLEGPPKLGTKKGQLILNRFNNTDDVWPPSRQCNIRYCVSKASSGVRYNQIVSAMAEASNAWGDNAGVKLVHVVGEDSSCTRSNSKVDFDVQIVTGQPYLARAFFPNQSRGTRNVFIDTSSFSVDPPLTLEGVLRHELGHALGFRHEHTRPEAGACFEDKSWKPLTPYDSESVMHYPQCNGTAGWALNLTVLDINGSVVTYGAPQLCSQN